jgi:hypothetical protein
MRFLFIGAILFFSYADLFATHLRCGQISIVEVSGKTVTIRIEYYTNIEGTNVLFGGDQDVLDFGDGTIALVPEKQGVALPNLPANTHYVSYQVTHTYNAFGIYIVSYREPNRNPGVLNFSSSVSTPAYIETKFTLSEDFAFLSAYSLLPPIFTGFAGHDFSASIAATAPNDDSISYSLAIPYSDRLRQVEGYKHPGIIIDQVRGLLTWDGYYQGAATAGEFLIAAKIHQHRKINGVWKEIGYSMRDYQILLEEKDSDAGTMTDSNNTANYKLDAGETTVLKVLSQISSGTVNYDVATDLPEEAFTLETYDSTSDAGAFRVGKLTLKTSAELKGTGYYVIAVRATFNEGDLTYQKDLVYTWGVTVPTAKLDYGPGITSITKSESKISLTPNPFSTELRLNNYNGRASLLVINGLGQVVESVRASDDGVFNLAHLPCGLYIIQAMAPNGKPLSVSRVIKH